MNATALVQPLDEHNRRLLSHVHPDGWRNPDPASRYDLVVIGGGTAGLVCAAGAAGLGARVALVERRLLGGDCLNTGCVPSKALLRSARAVHEAREASRLGVHVSVDVDFAAIMARVRARRADIAPHDSAARLASLGVDVFLGEATFSGRRAVAVAGRTLAFRRAVVATGGRPAVPPIPGLSGIPYLTSETVFWLTEQPPELLIIGAGAIGCELAQAFALLGTRVTLVDAAARVLAQEDPDASRLIAARLRRDGVRLLVDTTVLEVTGAGSRVAARLEHDLVSADALLIATGRAPTVDGLGLDAAGIRHGAAGIEVDDSLRTSNPHVYAAGDISSPLKFTHAADAMARIVIQNALFFGRRRMSTLVIPWCTYTLPQVAHVGLSVADAERAGCEAITISLEDVDRSVVDDEADGFVRIHHDRGRIVAATIVAPQAGELIGQVASIMRRGGSVGELSADVFPYPTVAEALRKAGDAYQRARLTPRLRGVLKRYFALMRSR